MKDTNFETQSANIGASALPRYMVVWDVGTVCAKACDGKADAVLTWNNLCEAHIDARLLELKMELGGGVYEQIR